jgi:hypothetical protein
VRKRQLGAVTGLGQHVQDSRRIGGQRENIEVLRPPHDAGMRFERIGPTHEEWNLRGEQMLHRGPVKRRTF